MAVKRVLIGNVKGPKGDTPEKGKDYFTEVDKAAMVEEVVEGLPDWSGGIDGLRKALNGIVRKVAAIAGFTDVRLKEHDTVLNERKVNVYQITDTMIRFACSTGDNIRECTLGLSNSKYLYTISQLGEYNIGNMSSATTANKTIVGLWVDGTRYDSLDVLKTDGFSFGNLMLLYTVAEASYTINACICLSADGIKVYESIPETVDTNPLNKGFITDFSSGSTVTPIMDLGENARIFSIKNGSKYFIERVEDLGQTVIRTIAFNGRL